MVLDIVAIVTPATGKEARVEEIIKDLSAKVKQNEPDVAKYMSYKTQSAEGATEYVFVERYKDEATLEAHQKSDYMHAVGKVFGEEALLAKGLTTYKLQALHGFDSR